MSRYDWIAAAAAVSTAIAAVAAAAAAGLQLIAMRRQRIPHLAAISTVTNSRVAVLRIVNTGPGHAVQVAYFLVDGNKKSGGVVGNGHLAPGEEGTVRLGHLLKGSKPLNLIYMCHDADWNSHAWANDGRYKKIPRKRVLAHDRTTFGHMFRELYPNVPIPD